MSCRRSGVWSQQEVDEFLALAKMPLRLACVGPDGYPRVVSLWFRHQSGVLYCVTHRESRLVALLRREQKVGFEVAPNEPPYYGVRGQGMASLQPLGMSDMLRVLLERYLGGLESSLAQWLLSRSDEEMLISIEPRRLFSWDYRRRMSDI